MVASVDMPINMPPSPSITTTFSCSLVSRPRQRPSPIAGGSPMESRTYRWLSARPTSNISRTIVPTATTYGSVG